MKLFGWLRGRRRREQELDEEIRTHFAMAIQERIEQGENPAEAEANARREFGNVGLVKEVTRDMWGWRWLETLLQDLRYGLRQLRRNPCFTAVAVLTLALGIGANTAIFSLVNRVLLRPLPYRDPGQLVWAAERFGGSHAGAVVISPDFIAWEKDNSVFRQIAASDGRHGANLTGAGEPARVNVMSVTASLFPMLGVRPILGRAFTLAEDSRGHDHVALLSESLWRTRFAARRDVLGRVIYLDNHAYTVVGVMPGSLEYPAADVWTPMALDGPRFSPRSPNWQILTVIACLRPGVTPRQARSNLQLITVRMNSRYSQQAASFRSRVKVEVVPLHELLVQNVRTLLLVLLGAVGFVLLVACANVANLLLSRTVARAREFAVRAALGAGRVRLMRQLLTESLILAAMGGVLGFLGGRWTVQLLKRLIPPSLPSEVGLDPRVFGFVAGIALLAVILFGLVPAMDSSRPEAGEALKASNAVAGKGTHRVRSLLLAAEIALSLILLTGAGLLARSFVRLSNVKLGFDPHHLLMASIWRPVSPGINDSEQAAFLRATLERVQSIPGIQQAAATTHPPLSIFNDLTGRLNIRGTGAVHLALPISVASISANYFRTMGIRLLKGRAFTESDSKGSPKVVIINETLAREAFKGRDPVGEQVSSGGPRGPWKTVVGVVADTRNYTLEQQPWPEMFESYLQAPQHFMTLAVRTSGAPLAMAETVRRAVLSVDKNQPLSKVESMDDVVAKSSAPQWFRTMLLGLFAVLALALTAIGIFGVMAYTVSQRTHEIGIRMALGAQKSDVLRMIVGQGVKLGLVGVAIGIAGAYALTRFLSSLLYGVKPTDPATFIAVSLILITVALLACYIPARRAAKVDPMVALRYE